MSFRSSIVAAALLATTARAHVTMQKPVIFSQEKAIIDTAPLTAEQFPCHSQYGFEVTKMNAMAVGEALEVELKGSAIHGGGSCQLSVTTDTEPTKDSKFKVIKSFEGGCPASNNAILKYTLPASIPNGKATFAWTWFSVLSGGPEMYMNCAPIEVSGGASDTTEFDALPDMLIANLGSATTCKSVINTPLKFPNPGADLVVGGSGGDKAAELPTGECGATGASPAPAPTNAPAPVASAPSGDAPVASAPAGDAPVATAPAGDAPAATAPAATAPAAPAPVASSPPIVAPPVASTAPTAPAPVGGSACSSNGAIECNGTTQFGICNNGSIVWQPVAAGTTCVNGAIQKRSAFKSSYNGRIVRPRAPVAYKY